MLAMARQTTGTATSLLLGQEGESRKEMDPLKSNISPAVTTCFRILIGELRMEKCL